MSLSTTQIAELKEMLVKQQGKLEDVLASLQHGDPSSNDNRTNDNADIGTEATESNELISYESLENETSILLDRTTAALARIADGTYGVTEDGVEIPYERLMVDPTATTVIN